MVDQRSKSSTVWERSSELTTRSCNSSVEVTILNRDEKKRLHHIFSLKLWKHNELMNPKLHSAVGLHAPHCSRLQQEGYSKVTCRWGSLHENTVSLVQKQKKAAMTAVSSDALNQLFEEELKVRSFWIYLLWSKLIRNNYCMFLCLQEHHILDKTVNQTF